jgi:hypothetical protein
LALIPYIEIAMAASRKPKKLAFRQFSLNNTDLQPMWQTKDGGLIALKASRQ